MSDTSKTEEQYVFGPAPSRRLGRSLGIDTVPLKTCNWNCVYCQLGRSTPVVNERKEYVPVDRILAEVRERLETLSPEAYDWITFVASGEGTLHSRIGELIHGVRQLSDHPIAVITNGSLLHLDEVRQAVAHADAVMPTLDACDEELYRRVNRPHPSLTFERHVAGIEAFARMKQRGKLWVEVMLVSGLNDNEPSLNKLADILSRIRPDRIDLTLPTRGSAERWVQPPDPDGQMRAQAILGPKAHLSTIPALVLDLDDLTALNEQIVALTRRHPLRVSDLEQALPELPRSHIHRVLEQLVADRRIQLVERWRTLFITGAGARFDT
jgi:wyosine [tRNA(Phe)-imidazoG37] synthetase (radical SAM superfamily)